MAEMTEQAIRDFWDAHPCGDSLVQPPGGDYEPFFQRYDALRYRQESHILRQLDAVDWRSRRVLEIGLGQGADAEQLIRRGAIWSGIDLSPQSVARVSARLRLRRLPFEKIACADVRALPFPDSTFDIVYSHGVLHHVPDVLAAQREIARVLQPGGLLVAMLYARRSMNYLVSISVLRRLGLVMLYLGPAPETGILAGHLSNAKKIGLWKYLKMSQFLHANTDGPANPYSKVYDLTTVARDFPAFRVARSRQEYMHAPPLPLSWLKPLAGVLGWHLWVHLISRKN